MGSPDLDSHNRWHLICVKCTFEGRTFTWQFSFKVMSDPPCMMVVSKGRFFMAQTACKQTTQDLHTNAHGLKRALSGKNQFVSELAVGMRVDSLFVLSQRESRIAANGTRYLFYVLHDRTGQIRGLEFDRTNFGDVPSVNSVVHVVGEIEGVKKRKHIKISAITATAEYNACDFLMQSLRPISEMSQEFGLRVQSLKDLTYTRLIKEVFYHDATYKKFIEAPLSDAGLYAYQGAALEKTLKACVLVDALCELYPQARKNLLVASALLHYVGSIDAFRTEAIITPTERGKNLGMKTLSLHIIESASRRYPVLQRAATAVETVILGLADSQSALALESSIFAQITSLIDSADSAQAQDFACGVVGL